MSRCSHIFLLLVIGVDHNRDLWLHHGASLGPHSTSSAFPKAQSSKGKRKVSSKSNPIADLFNACLRDEIEEAIGRFLFSNGIPLHVTHSPYYKDMV